MIKKVRPIRGIKPIKPIKPIDRIQNIPKLPKIGQRTLVKGHWRYNYSTRKYEWVPAHYRK